MYRLAVIYLAAVLAGFSLILVTFVAPFLAPIEPTLVIIGGVAIIIFTVAILYLALRALLNKIK